MTVTPEKLEERLTAYSQAIINVVRFHNRPFLDKSATETAAQFDAGEAVEATLRAARAQGIEPRRVLDVWGANTGFIERLRAALPLDQAWVCDFESQAVARCEATLPSDIGVFLSTYLPILPLPDGTLDVVTAFTAFTQIDELETAWLLELKRVLRKGGMAYVWVRDEHGWPPVEQPALLARIRQDPAGANRDLGAPLGAEKLAFHPQPESHFTIVSFYAQAYIRKTWGRFFQVAQIEDGTRTTLARITLIND